MRSAAPPVLSASFALLWCLASALDSEWLALVITVASLWGAAALALERRRRATLRWILAAMMLVLAAGLALVLTADARSGLPLQLGLMAVLAPIAPIVYAATAAEGERGS